MIGLAHPDLVGPAARELEALRLSPAALDLELEVGDRAVERVVLGPLGVGVDPGDEVAGIRRHPAAQLQALARELELARRRPLVELRRQDAVEATEPVLGAVDSQHPVGDPRRGQGTDLDPTRGEVQVVAPLAAQVSALDPHPALGVLSAPIVADHPRPVGELDPLVPHGHRATEPRARVGAEELRAGQRRVVKPLIGQVVKRLAGVVEAEVPARLELGRLQLAGGAAGLEHRPVDADVGALGRRELPGGEVGLDRPRPRRVSVEDGQPQRGRRLLGGPLVDGVADPNALPARRPRGLQIEALVVARLALQAGKAGLGSHGRNLPAAADRDALAAPAISSRRPSPSGAC